MVSDAEFIKIIKENSSVMKENSLVLQGIRDDIKDITGKYAIIGTTLVRIEVMVGVLVIVGVGGLIKLLFG